MFSNTASMGFKDAPPAVQIYSQPAIMARALFQAALAPLIGSRLHWRHVGVRAALAPQIYGCTGACQGLRLHWRLRFTAALAPQVYGRTGASGLRPHWRLSWLTAALAPVRPYSCTGTCQASQLHWRLRFTAALAPVRVDGCTGACHG